LRKLAAMAPDDPDRARIRERVINGYLPVAQNIAHRYARRGEPLPDLVQVACIGLIKAVDRFEPDQGHNFLSFAVPTITGEIRRHFRDRTWSMRVPRRLKELHVAVSGVIDELSSSLNRAPRPGEIAARLNISVDDVLEALQASQSYRAFSLEETLPSESASSTLSDLLGRHEPRFDRFTDSHAVAPHLSALAPRERDILIMRFYEDMTQTQIAERIGVSQMHVSRLLSATLSRLREAVDDDVAVDPTEARSA
jgi:RNA polymerase sigma-B factor